MEKWQVRKRIVSYLKEHNINNCLINDHGKPMLQKDLDTIYLNYNIQVPGGLESDMKLFEDKLYVRAYYTEEVANEIGMLDSEKIHGLRQVINYINANAFFESLYTPRLYLSTDGYYDIAIKTVIPYDFFELAPIETLEYITAYYPECMEKFAVPLLFLIYKKMSVDQAIDYIDSNILNGNY